MFLIKEGKYNENGTLIDECRPISISSPLFKILEKIILRRIRKGVQQNRIRRISSNQIGFMKEAIVMLIYLN